MDIKTEILNIKKKKKAIEQELDCEFIRIDTEKRTLIFLKLSTKYLDTSSNSQINGQSTKNMYR